VTALVRWDEGGIQVTTGDVTGYFNTGTGSNGDIDTVVGTVSEFAGTQTAARVVAEGGNLYTSSGELVAQPYTIVQVFRIEDFGT
jgi:hypothetical protein